jgi:hypothetical protein
MNTVLDRPDVQSGVSHLVLPYESEQDFLSGAVPFLRAGTAAGDAVLAISGRVNLGMLRECLGPEAAQVQFIEAATFYRHPTRTLARCLSLADELARQGRRLRLLGEPIWHGRTPAQVADWQRAEASVNVAFADTGASILCPYDLRLPLAILDGARRTHPVAVHGGERSRQQRIHGSVGVHLRLRPAATAPTAHAHRDPADRHCGSLLDAGLRHRVRAGRGGGGLVDPASPHVGYRGGHQCDTAWRSSDHAANVDRARRRHGRCLPRSRCGDAGVRDQRRRSLAADSWARLRTAGALRAGQVRAVGGTPAVLEGAGAHRADRHDRTTASGGSGVTLRKFSPPDHRWAAYSRQIYQNRNGRRMETWFAERPVGDLRPGDHAWLAFNSNEEQNRVIGDFVFDGLNTQEKVVYVTDSKPLELPGLLSRHGIDPTPFTEVGQLRLIPPEKACQTSGRFDPDRMLKTLNQEVSVAFDQGLPSRPPHCGHGLGTARTWRLGSHARL